MIHVSTWFNGSPVTPTEHVFPGSQVQPDQALGLREIIDRFSRGVPAVGKVNMNFDKDPESLMNCSYVFPDDPDFADYVYAQRHLNELYLQFQQASQLSDAKQSDTAASEQENK